MTTGQQWDEDEALAEYIRAEVARAPALNREQLDALALVLRPAVVEHRAARSSAPRPRRKPAA